MIAYCGIDCSKCDSYLAAQSGNDEELERVAKRLAKLYHADVKPEYVICEAAKPEKDIRFIALIHAKCENAVSRKSTIPALNVLIFPAKNCSLNWTIIRKLKRT